MFNRQVIMVANNGVFRGGMKGNGPPKRYDSSRKEKTTNLVFKRLISKKFTYVCLEFEINKILAFNKLFAKKNSSRLFGDHTGQKFFLRIAYLPECFNPRNQTGRL